MSLHPLVQASIEADDCVGCKENEPYDLTCDYHHGMQEALDAVAPDLAIAERASGDVWVRNAAVEIADWLRPPDFQTNPNENEWAIDYIEELLTRHVAAVLGDDQ